MLQAAWSHLMDQHGGAADRGGLEAAIRRAYCPVFPPACCFVLLVTVLSEALRWM